MKLGLKDIFKYLFSSEVRESEALTGEEIIPVEQKGTIRKTTTQDIANLVDVSTIQVDGGNQLEPSITFASDTDTGLFRVSSNQLGIAIGGDMTARFTTLGLLSDAVKVDDGSEAAPTYAFNNDNTSGFYLISPSEIGLSIGGVKVASFNANGIKLSTIPTYANEAAAVTGGLTTGQVYKVSTGELRIKL